LVADTRAVVSEEWQPQTDAELASNIRVLCLKL
jgi:hypothetical protein